MATAKKIVIAEDHTILREGLRSLLNSAEQYEVAGEAADGLEAIHCVERCNPDLILLDLSMPRMGGASVIKEVKSRFPGVKVLALSVHDSEEYILETFQLGADGYCTKAASKSELLMAIASVLSGKRYISPDISEKVLEGFIEERKTLKAASSWDTLTQREKEVLKMVGEGYKNKDISDFLCISVKTVQKHRANIMRKLNLHTASLLTSYAIEKGLVEKPNQPPQH
ncbi:MAG: response regulator [Thermodesulfobacteriota bacterium]